MPKKKSTPRPTSCGECKHSTPYPSRKGDPAIVLCGITGRRMVRDARRICDRAG